MSVTKQLRRGALAISIAAIGVLGMGGTALAGDVATGGGSLSYTGDATAETLTVTQSAATVVTFDLTGAPVTTSDAACVASNSNTADADNEVSCTLAGLDDISADMMGGNDSLTATASVQVEAQGGTGDDHIDLRAATFDGGDLSPNMQFCCSTNAVSGGDGNDTVLAGPNDTLISGNDGNDTLTGGPGDDLINGGTGLDTIAGAAGDDYLSGGDVFVVSPFSSTSDGADSIDGGLGSDTASYAGRTIGVSVDLKVAGGQGQANENDTFTSVENVDGGNGDDTLTGNDASNIIWGNDGKDLIAGGRAFDEVHGGRDADSIQMAGDVTPDLIDCGRGFSSNTVGGVTTKGADADVTKMDYLDYLSTGADCETVTRNIAPARAPQLGTGDHDRIVGDGNRDLLIGLDGDDTLIGLNDSDELQGGFGTDRLFGGAGPDDLQGGYGNDGIIAGNGNDTITGGPGRDYLMGNAGVDTILGGEGVDRMDGGAGRDYLLARDDVRDTVICTRTRIASQQDVVFADPEDRVVNAFFCARIARS
jgi:Ca2+-binding RTX toxin-like protein